MKKILTLSLVLCLLLGGQAAWAGKKKKPKPYKSDTVSTGFGHPVFYGNSGGVQSITAKEFENTCAIPGSNGVDAYVFEVPKEWQKYDARVEAIGHAAGPVGYDLDMFVYDASCQVMFAFQAAGTDETGVLPKGAAFVLVHNYTGDPNTTTHIEISL